MSVTEPGSARNPNRPDALAELYTLLSRCFERPDETFVEALRSGQFDEELHSRGALFGLVIPDSPAVESLADLRVAYRRSFESYDGAAAPPVESVYEPWHDGRMRKILSGPAAHDMKRRFEVIDATVPAQYQPDHLAVELEYVSLILEAGEFDAYEQFHREHFDWIPAFERRVRETCDEPFYRWAVTVLARVTEAVEHWLDESRSGGET